MNSLIFQTASKLLMPLLIVFSVVILMRGHNDPGGGFVGGLVAAAAVAMYSMAFGVTEAKRLLRGIPLTTVIGVGLLIALVSGLAGMFIDASSTGLGDASFMKGWWNVDENKNGWIIDGLGEIKLGTVVLFDIGVYVTVFGVVLLMLFELEEAQDNLDRDRAEQARLAAAPAAPSPAETAPASTGDPA